MATTSQPERGAAVVDFVLGIAVVVPLVLGILQLALVLHVRNTLASAASEGARYGATWDHSAAEGAARTRRQISTALSPRYAGDVHATTTTVNGTPTVIVTVHARVPALGLGGPAVSISVTGRAVEETP